MLWWFERDGRKTRVEVLNLASGNYELHVIDGDGIERVEHFAEAGALAKRQQQIQDSLVSLGWKGPERWIG